MECGRRNGDWTMLWNVIPYSVEAPYNMNPLHPTHVALTACTLSCELPTVHQVGATDPPGSEADSNACSVFVPSSKS